ncbi:TlpA disulfide reductase family protein [Sphingobacterium sp. DR205]|uniref:TlpA family protein disulfide reductase n=1 Tax=Sphingobacterium sp. DR205 TaxID=2713573 RepID=UPI0013E4938B|nr:TlpA disulfide reductase family protein [Sphingobacterium sp. DR205]QIH35941.1 TlpA family protein disulfide reductase [Sphingobacterium sp. DR205]
MKNLFKIISTFVLVVALIDSYSQQSESMSLKKGEKPSIYDFKDLDNNRRYLDEFKGKFVLIDVWASWCFPCLKEMPSLDLLRHHYKDKNLVVVGVSVDDKDYKWRGAVVNLKIPSHQFNVDKEKRFEKEFDIKYIPRMILLDKEGKVYNERMPKPSDIEIYSIIDEALSSVN